MLICVITCYCKVVVGPGTQFCTLLEEWVLGVGMSTLDTQTVVRRVSGASSTDDPGSCPRHLQRQSAPRSDPRIRHRIQIDMFRSIRVDHTNFLQVDFKTH